MGFWPDTFSGNQTNPKDITIHGYAGSTAETYAADNDHTFSAFIIPAIPDDALRKAINARSEERRVGKECRSRWSTKTKKKRQRDRYDARECAKKREDTR